MFHFVARARVGTLLFHSEIEGRRLWSGLARLDGLLAACVMPDHVHVLLREVSADDPFGQMMSAFARWRNARRRERGPAWSPHPPPESVPDALHLQRTLRYIHLNPCRGGLVEDPLAWPFSTHRDALGLAPAPALPRQREPERFHAYVSADPTTAVTGTPFPHGAWGGVSTEDVLRAVAGVCRLTVDELRARGEGRALLVQTAWLHELGGAEVLGAMAGLTRQQVWRLCHSLRGRSARLRPALAACMAAVGDARFQPLDGRDLRRDPRIIAYRARHHSDREGTR